MELKGMSKKPTALTKHFYYRRFTLDLDFTRLTTCSSPYYETMYIIQYQQQINTRCGTP